MHLRGAQPPLHRPTGGIRRRAVCLLSLLCTLLLPAPHATAQFTDDPVDLRLIQQPVWHGPEDDLGITVRARNLSPAPLEGLTLAIEVHERVTTRSGLQASFDGDPGFFGSGTSLELPDVVLGPGEETDLPVDLAVDDLSSLVAATEGGVYPLRITVGSGGTELASLTTPLIYFPSPPEARLKVVLVIPINEVPARDAAGRFVSRERGSLEEAVVRGGWLDGLMRGLRRYAGTLPPIRERVPVARPEGRRDRRPRFRVVRRERPSLHVALAPTPRLVEELGDLADGYRSASEGAALDDPGAEVGASAPVPRAARDVLTRLGSTLGEEGIQPLLVPYGFPDLPTLARVAPEHASDHIDVGTRVMSERLGIDTSDEWLFAPAGRVDAGALAEIGRATTHTFFNDDALHPIDPTGCPQTFASFACVASVRGPDGPITGYVLDDLLQLRLASLARSGNDRLDLQSFFAELATIFHEAPGDPTRVVSAVIPSVWRPRPRLTGLLLRGLLEAAWIKTVTPAEGVADPGLEARPRRLVTGLEPLGIEADTAASDALEVSELVSSFELIQPPTQLTRRFATNPLVAESRMWQAAGMEDEGRAYIDGTVDLIDTEMSKIKLEGRSDVVLTSDEGEFPLVLFTEGDYPATVDLRVSSEPDLVIEPELIEDQRVEPGTTHQLTLSARARSSGIFQVSVALEAPDGGLQIARKVVRIRSTQFNEIALAITVGALAFLVLFYVGRIIRRRRSTPEEAT